MVRDRRHHVLPWHPMGPSWVSLHRFRVFTLEEANRLLPRVSEITDEARGQLEALDGQSAEAEEARRDLTDRTRDALDAWSRAILELGAQPKGIFTVDFRSPDPNVLWCWAPDEPLICHRHFTWESFKDRVPLDGATLAWPCRN